MSGAKPCAEEVCAKQKAFMLGLATGVCLIVALMMTMFEFGGCA